MISPFRLYPAFVVISLLLGTCANERPISGGPEDKTPPQIVFSTPVNESVNTSINTEIFIKFNEQMKKTTIGPALQIWPRPPGGYELKTGWTWLKLTFNEPLEPEETYLLTLDKSALDLRGNALDATYVLAFSTGDCINSGRLSGFIQGTQDVRKNGDIYLYRNIELPLSELRQIPADYIFQPDDDGRFELPYLAERSYMLFYHWDRNRNKQIDGGDYFARPEQATVLARSDSIAEQHKLWPHLRSPGRVKLLEVTELEAQFIQIRTSRPVSYETLNRVDLFVNDTSADLLGRSLVAEDEYAMHLNLAHPILDSSQVWLKNFKDTSGFELDSDTLRFFGKAAHDTLGLSDFRVHWASGKQVLFPDETNTIQIGANLPFVINSDSAFQLVDSRIDTLPIAGKLQISSSMQWEFSPDTTLEDGHTYKWQILTDHIQAALNGRELDSLIQGELKIVDSDSLGSLRVMHMGNGALQCVLTGRNVEEHFELKRGVPTLINSLPVQQYTLSAYADQNGDGRYNSGGLETDAGAEPFWIFPDYIRVRARWETDLGVWELK